MSDSTIDDPTVIVKPETTARRGPKPLVLTYGSAKDEAETVLSLLRERHEASVSWANMAILFGNPGRRGSGMQSYLYFGAQRLGIPYFWVTMNARAKRDAMSRGDVVRVANFQGLKGLEFSRVFVCAVDDIWDPDGEDLPSRYRLTYVALTRAMDELVVTVSGNGPIGQALQRAGSL